jgi:hypothetical protein
MTAAGRAAGVAHPVTGPGRPPSRRRPAARRAAVARAASVDRARPAGAAHR